MIEFRCKFTAYVVTIQELRPDVFAAANPTHPAIPLSVHMTESVVRAYIKCLVCNAQGEATCHGFATSRSISDEAIARGIQKLQFGCITGLQPPEEKQT